MQEEESRRIFTLVMENVWGNGINEDGQAELRDWQARSPYHRALADKLMDLEWINTRMTQLRGFSKAEVKQRVMQAIVIPEESVVNKATKKRADDLIEAAIMTDHIKVHKYWRVLFVVQFILVKILLALCIYLYKLLEAARG